MVVFRLFVLPFRGKKLLCKLEFLDEEIIKPKMTRVLVLPIRCFKNISIKVD